MHPIIRRRIAVPLVPLVLAGGALSPSIPPHAAYGMTRPAASRAITAVQRTHHVHLYGYLQDAHPSTDPTLDLYSKAHRVHYAVLMTRTTVVKRHGLPVHRAQLAKGLYVLATCQRNAHGALEALAVSIIVRHYHSHKTT